MQVLILLICFLSPSRFYYSDTNYERQYIALNPPQKCVLKSIFEVYLHTKEKAMAPYSSTFAWKIHGRRSLVGCSPWGREESGTTERLHFHFQFHALEEEMATHSSVLAWRIPGTGEPGGLLSMGSHRVRHDGSDLAYILILTYSLQVLILSVQFNEF